MKISITDCDQASVDIEKNIIEGAGFSFAVYKALEPAQVIKIAKDSDAIICQYAQINRDVLKSMRRCKVVGRYGVGLDNIDVEAATEFGIKITHVPFFCFQDAANHAMSLILALSRNIVQINRLIRENNGKLNADYGQLLRFMDNVERPSEQTIGIIGLGKIGTQVAKRAKAFGYKILVYDPYLPAEIISSLDAVKTDLPDLLKKSDFVTIHCPLNKETRALIGRKEIASMKKNAYLINTARGKIIDESALISALKAKKIKGAALDVLEKEPVAYTNELLGMDNCILTPHVSFYSKKSLHELKSKTAQFTVNALKRTGEYYLANPDTER